MGTEIVVAAQPADYMPALTIAQSLERHRAFVDFVRSEIMKTGVDYGKIPGSDKDTLLKPGAEKLCTFFGFRKRFRLVRHVEDWTGAGYNGEPFFYYLYRCQLIKHGEVVAECDGSCNSREAKYRWRNASRKCPGCGKEAIIKGKKEYGGGWLCFKKKDGCGATFPDGDQRLESQVTGRVPNPDVADTVNTIQKMAQKRALIGATLLAVNASDFFTQDLDDLVGGDGDDHEPNPPKNNSQAPQNGQTRPNQPAARPAQAPRQQPATPAGPVNQDAASILPIDGKLRAELERTGLPWLTIAAAMGLPGTPPERLNGEEYDIALQWLSGQRDKADAHKLAKPQREEIERLAKLLKWNARALHEWCAKLLGAKINTIDELTVFQGDRLIEDMAARVNKPAQATAS
jgi:hypothetical protein